MTDHELLIEIYGHMKIMNSEMGDLTIQMAVMNNRVEMLERWFWIFVVAVVGAIVTSVWNLIKHNNLMKNIENGKKK